MGQRLRLYWGFVSGGLWFLPTVMAAAAVLLAVGLLRLGAVLPEGSAGFWLLYSGDADSARELLAAMLGGMISMASLVVSITMVVLTLAAGQIGPRLVRSFMADRQTQASLGLFAAVILYLLVVLRTIEGGSAAEVPHAAVTGGTLLTALAILVLLLHVHRLATSIVYDNVVRRVGHDLDGILRRMLPERRQAPGACPAPPAGGLAWVGLDGHGYVQGVDHGAMVAAAAACGVRVVLALRPGDYVLARGRAFGIHPAAACTPALAGRLRGAVVLGAERTEAQDAALGFQRLSEVATRALSPGINDVFTAVAVVDTVSASLALALGRGAQPGVLCDGEGEPRLFRPPLDPADLVAPALDPMRQAAAGSPLVLCRMAAAMGRLAPYLDGAGERARAILLAQLDAVEEGAGKAGLAQRDLDMVRRACAAARRELGPLS